MLHERPAVERKPVIEKELLSAVIHEIKNSLNPVINLSGVLYRDTSGRLTDDEHSYLEVMGRNGKKIFRLVDELSFLAKLSGGDRDVQPVSVRVGETVNDAFLSAVEAGNSTGVKPGCDIDGGQVVINTDKELFCRVVRNICLFFLSLETVPEPVCFRFGLDNSLFRMSVSCGLPGADFTGSEVFDTGKALGMGYSTLSVIWLHFVEEYVFSMGGRVYFDQDDRGSAVFSVTIPSAEELADTGFPAGHGREVRGGFGREFVMLVIDDDADNIIPVNAIVENEFRGRGRVYHAVSGGAGLDMLGKISPDIVLLDLTLPDISGFSLVRNIKNIFVKTDVPVIAFTALDIASDADKMSKAGFDDVIKKPFNIDTFTWKIKKWIR